MGRCDDPRLVVGATVHAKAVHIVHYAECARLYGSLAGTKLVSGTVTSFTRQVKSGRSMTGITATWDLASGTVEKHLMLLNVKRVGAPSVDHSAVDQFGFVPSRRGGTDRPHGGNVGGPEPSILHFDGLDLFGWDAD